MPAKERCVKIFLEARRSPTGRAGWFPAREYQARAFGEFRTQTLYEVYMYNHGSVIFYILEKERGRSCLCREDKTKSPIADWNDVKFFLNYWCYATEDLTWAYFDFIYSDAKEKYYKSKDSTDLLEGVDYTEIPIDNLPPGINFKFSIGDDETIWYEKNDTQGNKNFDQ